MKYICKKITRGFVHPIFNKNSYLATTCGLLLCLVAVDSKISSFAVERRSRLSLSVVRVGINNCPYDTSWNKSPQIKFFIKNAFKQITCPSGPLSIPNRSNGSSPSPKAERGRGPEVLRLRLPSLFISGLQLIFFFLYEKFYFNCHELLYLARWLLVYGMNEQTKNGACFAVTITNLSSLNL